MARELNTSFVSISRPMLAVAERKLRDCFGQRLELIESDVGAYLDHYSGPPADLVTCVGFLHHLQPAQLKTMLERIRSVLAGGQLVVAEPIVQPRVPRFIQRWNAGSILVQRLAEAMPPGAQDPEEAPLEESDLFAALRSAGLSTVQISRGFELFHRTNPLTRAEKMCVRLVYAFFRRRGDVLAVLSQKPGIDPLR